MDKLLNKLYYIDKNYDGVNELYRKAKLIDKSITKSIVSNWLKDQATHQQTTSKVGVKIFKPIYSNNFYAYQCDLTFLPQYKKSNDGYYVLFTAININSRYSYVYWSKKKDEISILDMLNKFKKDSKEINLLTMDSGTEFTNKGCTKWFLDNNIKTFYCISDSHKLGIINRFHRTLKEKLLKYMTAEDNTRWIDVIDKIVKNYNNSINRGTGYTPTEASNSFIQSMIISKAEDKTNEIIDDEIKINDECRLKVNKELFQKMKIKYSNEIYKIIKVKKNTVDIENDNHILKNIKKYDILIIKNSENNKQLINKTLIEKNNKSENKLRREGLSDYNNVGISK